MNPIVWKPSGEGMAKAALLPFSQRCGVDSSLPPEDLYRDLHRWSITHPERFWRQIWNFGKVIGEQGELSTRFCNHFLDTKWFPDARLNFAENLLRDADDRLAIIACNERGDRRMLTRRELRSQSLGFAQWLREQGVQSGDRVAAVLPNVAEAIIAMLGTAAIGAVWSSCSPDFGDDAICDRFQQIEPKVLVTIQTASYFGKTIDVLAKVEGILPRLPSVQRMVVVGTESFETIGSTDLSGFNYERFPFAHPLAILYSSGTTGAPKCIVHGAGGTLLQHLKEHQLHCNLKPGDRLFYYTTTGWMMWNWLTSALASQAAIVLYDGSPLHPSSDALWKLASEEGVTHFGASAKYYAAVEKVGIKPRESVGLSKLRVVMSTGSPLLPESFDYVYRDVKSDVLLASISGGTDIISCFALGCPILPVRRGELQVKGLGMDARVFNDDGCAVVGEPGELVCISPFPSMPVAFWNDPDGAKYRAAYFERFDNIWCHGDWAEETPSGGFVIHGRSDATLNPSGVRIGTAEIYNQVESFDGVAEALATANRRGGDERIVLFLRMKPGCAMTADLVREIKQRLRSRCSPRHVPTFVIEAADFPRTISGKLSEIAVRNAIHQQPIRNLAALANPESLLFFQTRPEFSADIS